MLDIKKLRKVHFIGIVSPFDSFCANYLLDKGIEVTASEINQNNPVAREWIERGVLFEGGHNAKYITDDLDLVVYPNGPIPGNPECEQAEKKNVPTITLPKLVGLISRNFKVIAISGTHGKTTTSALTIWIMYKALGVLPNFIIGDYILGIDKSWNFSSDSEYLVLEACEYKKQFLDRAPSPYISVVTNIELDHTDYYKSQEQYNEAFVEFLSNTQKAIVVDSTGENVKDVLKKVGEKEIVDIKDIDHCENVTAGLKGEYNRENVLRACGVAKVLGLDIDIEDFPGVASRFEFKGNTPNGMPVYLDYAHNPTKVKACLRATRESFPGKKVLFVWQPHSFERTYSFKEKFAQSIGEADIVYIPNIYAPTREERRYRELISEREFVDYLQEENKNIQVDFTDGVENTSKLLLDDMYNDEYVCVLASAGDLHQIIPMLSLDK